MNKLIGEFFGLGNDWAKYISSKTMLLLSGFVVLTVLLVWSAAALFSNAAPAIALVMWVGLLAFSFFFFQPAIGYIALVRWLRGKGDPNQRSILCLYAWGVVVILMAGTLGIIANWLNAAIVYPFVIIMIIGIVAVVLLTVTKNIEKWLRIIALTMTVVAVGTTIGAVLDNNREILARIGIDTREYSVRPSETAKLTVAEKDRAIRDRREKAKADSILALMECNVSQKSQKIFTTEQTTLYKKYCVESMVKGMTLDDVRMGWPDYFPQNKAVPRVDGEKVGRGDALGHTASGWWDSYMRFKDASPLLFWSTLILGHVIFFWWIRKALHKKTATSTSASSAMGGKLLTWLLIGLLAFGAYKLWPDIREGATWIADTPSKLALKDAVPITDNLIGPGGTHPKEWSAVLNANYIPGIRIATQYPLALSADSYISFEEVYLRIRTEGGFTEGGALPSDLVIRGACRALETLGRHFCRGQWIMESAMQTGQFEYHRYPTGGSIRFGSYDQYGTFHEGQMIFVLHHNLKPL